MKTTRGKLLALLATTAFCVVPSTFAQDAPTLPEGVSVKFEKTENQPAVAIATVDGVETRIEAFEPLDKLPESVREYVRAEWTKTGEFPAKTINVEVDVTDAPDAAEWAESAKNRLIYWFPKIVEALDGKDAVAKIPDDYTIRLVFKNMDGVAYAAGREITVSSNWIKKSPNDFGLVVHEATHVVQAYRRGEFWTTEGIADYVRYYVSEPRSRNHWRIDPERSSYKQGYGIAATFFDWMIREKDPEFLIKLHRALRARKNGEKFFAEEYQTTPDALWKEFVETL